MSELTFEGYARQLTEASSILPDDAIMGFLAMRKMQPIMLYVYRIAAYCVQELRLSGKLPNVIDDTDYIDAVQECIVHAPGFVRGWSKTTKHKFTTYVNAACKNIASNYLWKITKGGTDYGQGAGDIVDQIPEFSADDIGDDEQDAPADFNQEPSYGFPPQGYRDPLEELIAAEDEDRALRALQQPCATQQETRLRNSRVRRTLGLQGVRYD